MEPSLLDERKGDPMKGLLAFALAALVSGAAAGQMMGGPIATSNHFPLVDGARHEYVHAGGPWATSTTIVRTGQAWAGYSGLAAMHTTYVCNVGVSCATAATDFYRVDADGVRHFGGTGADPSGSLYGMTALGQPEWMLKNPVMPGTMMGGPGGGYANAESWQAGVSGTGSMMGAYSYMSRYHAQAVETVTTPAGTFADCLHVREQRGNGYVRDVWYAPGVGMVRMQDANGTATLTGYTMPGPVAQPGGGAAPLPFTPFDGLWWNPGESGTGYNIQVQRGVMVATLFSYTPAGDPVWYYATGPLVRAGNGVTVTASLDRYRGGPCVSCGYSPPTAAGNDGVFSIEFSSPTAAMVRMPGGRATRIQPQGW